MSIINALPVFREIYTEKKIANNHLAEEYCDSLEIFLKVLIDIKKLKIYMKNGFMNIHVCNP